MGKSTGILTNAALLLDFIRYKPNLKRLLSRIVEPQDTDDILQETYIRVCAASQTTKILNTRSFMLKTAQNLAFNHVTTAYHRHSQLEDFSCPDVHQLTEDLETQLEGDERFLGFCRAVRALPLQCRRAFILRKVYGLSQQEIARYLDISESTVEKHVAKGLLLSRESMLRMGHIEAGQLQDRIKNGTK